MPNKSIHYENKAFTHIASDDGDAPCPRTRQRHQGKSRLSRRPRGHRAGEDHPHPRRTTSDLRRRGAVPVRRRGFGRLHPHVRSRRLRTARNQGSRGQAHERRPFDRAGTRLYRGVRRLDLRGVRHRDGQRHAVAALVALLVERRLQQHRLLQVRRDAFQPARLRFAVHQRLFQRHPPQRRPDGLHAVVAVERSERRHAQSGEYHRFAGRRLRTGRHRRDDQHQRHGLADPQGPAREPGQRQFDVPFPCDGLLRLRSARQWLVVCLLRIDATGRQRLGQRHLLQLLRLLRIGGETLQRAQPADVHDPRRSDRAWRAAGFDAGGLRPGRQQLLQSQLGLSGRQETQRPRAQQPRAADGRQLHQHARRPHEDRRSGLVPLRYERLLGPHVEGRCRPASRLLPQPAQLLHGQQPVLECGPDRRAVAYELRHPSDQLGPALRHQLPRRDRRRDLRRRTPLELHDRGAPHRPARPEPHGADRPHVPRQFAPRRRHPLPLEPHRILRQGERPAGRRLLGGHRQVRRARLRG